MIMARCRYKTRVLGEEWECHLDALTGERYCYWHKEEDGKKPTERGLEELKEKKILGVYLQGVNLVGAELQGATLHRANLQDANLGVAELREANLFGANLLRANLFGANLQGANLAGTKLQGANLGVAELQGAKMGVAELQGANLGVAELREANLFGANLQGANLFGAKLQGANLFGANLQGANLAGTKFNSQTVLDNSRLIGVNLFHSYFDEAKSFRNAKAFQNEGDREINEIAGDALDSWFIWSLENGDIYPAKMVLKITSFVLNKNLKNKT